ncbi:MAG: 4'-phosphopantetheinyl transferase superfamily protein [Planctomycetota bacterium]
MSDSNWETPQGDFPHLEAGQVHIWRLSLRTQDGDYEPFTATLDDQEKERGARFIFAKHRERFIVGRARVRELLSSYADCDPDEFEYTYDNLGKPRFKDETLDQRIKFNFSNSADLGLLAVTLETELGVDLEKIRPMHDMMGMAKRYFAESETEQLFALDEPDRPDAFFRCWTRKEAYLKAVGKGLTFPLRDVEVSLLPQDDCCIHNINSDADNANRWSLIHVAPHDNYHGALAIPDPALSTVRLLHHSA